MNETVLYDYPKSSAAYRVRIALNLAGISFRSHQVNLLTGAHRTPDHVGRNPQGLVPVLEIDGHRFTQSLAILDYLDTTREMGLLPREPAARTKAKALAMCIAVDLHPVCNLSVATYATGGQEPARTDWMQHFISPGLVAFEAFLAEFEQSPFATGAQPGLADICLIPQLYNANRWGADYEGCTRIKSVEDACADVAAFRDAAP